MSALKVNTKLVTKLVAEQFPEWSNLEIKPTETQGFNNNTFCLGKDKLIRLPTAERYALQNAKLEKWLPKFVKHLSLEIPMPIRQAEPSELFPWRWSIYKWIEGKSANLVKLKDIDLNQAALDLAQFLNEFHKINTSGAPEAGAESFYRGAHPSVYDKEIQLSIKRLQHCIDANKATKIWHQALQSSWNKPPVWVHGDFTIGNIIINNNRVAAIIDFGGIVVGDPACDLMVAWTLFDKENRSIFKSHLSLDEDTWKRGRGWTLWKCLQESGPESLQREKILAEIFSDYDYRD